MNTRSLRFQRGFTIIELMVAVAIGLILMLGATGILVTNQNTFRTTANLSGIQDNSRTAVELLARDIREAGGHPCSSMQIVNRTGGDANGTALFNQLNNDKSIAINGADNPGNRVANQGSILLLQANAGTPITAHATGSSTITAENSLKGGDFVIACTRTNAYLLKVASANSSSLQVAAPPDTRLEGGTLAAGVSTHLWYIGTNADGRPNSLYRREGSSGNGTEMVDNIAGLTVTWFNQPTNAVKIDLTLCSNEIEPGETLSATQRAQQTCPANRLERHIHSVIQPRTS